MLAADVELTEGILSHVRGLHDDLIEQLIVAAGLRGDGLLVDDVGGCAGLGLNAVTGLVQTLCDHGDRIERRARAVGRRIECGRRVLETNGNGESQRQRRRFGLKPQHEIELLD